MGSLRVFSTISGPVYRVYAEEQHAGLADGCGGSPRPLTAANPGVLLQLTVPQRVRDQLAIRPGDDVGFVNEESLVVLRRIAHLEHVNAAVEGVKLVMRDIPCVALFLAGKAFETTAVAVARGPRRFSTSSSVRILQ